MEHTRLRRTSRARPLIAIAAIGCLGLLAGCGGDDTSTTGTAASAPAQCSGPVEDCLGFTRRGIAAASANVENRIATCMKAEGFEYVPADPVAVQAALTGKPNMSDAEFETLFGYGITTLYGKGSPQTDPNSRIRAKLGAADLRAYDRALSGGKPDQTFALAVDTGDFSQLGGCTKQATDEALGGAGLLTTLQRKLDELDDSIAADQRVVKAQQAWGACMRAATGDEYEDAEDIEDAIKKEFERLVGQIVAPGQVAPEGTNVDMAALTALQRREIDLSSKDLACERKHITPVESKVRAEKEAAFRDANADLLRKVKPLGS
jgi:hypothetical protein